MGINEFDVIAVNNLGDNATQELTSAREIKTRYIKPHTERMLWGVSAGQCEFRGCTRILYRHHITKQNVNQADKAHIYAFSGGGKRYNPTFGKINNIDNLMLLCDGCHKLIDSEDTDYSAEELLAMKQEHEERVARLINIKADAQSEVVIYNANIADKSVHITNYSAWSAILPEYYPASVHPIDISPRLLVYDFEENYWNIMAEDLQRELTKHEGSLMDRHIALFAIAPQPLLFRLGMLLNRNYDVDVRQPQGSIADWLWSSENLTIDVHTQTLPKRNDDAVILTMEFTARLSEKEIRNSFGGGPVYRIYCSNCGPDVIRSKKDLISAICEYRRVLNEIRAIYGGDTKVKFVAIAPASVSIEAGRQLMKGDPQLIIYDRNYMTKKWVEALIVNGGV